jgi:hypothetical protein
MHDQCVAPSTTARPGQRTRQRSTHNTHTDGTNPSEATR